MGKMGEGYGSEWHLLRMLGRHRTWFNQHILKEVNIESFIEWEDFSFSEKQLKDRELRGIEFLKNEVVKKDYTDFWPSTGSPPNWDAVGWMHGKNGEKELLLVEAKAHIHELKSNCGASINGGLELIQKTLNDVKGAFGIPDDHNDWLKNYYQYANRLAFLCFLNDSGIPTRLINIYFIGDEQCKGPQNKSEWELAIKEKDKYLGLQQGHPLGNRIHNVFIKLK